MSYERPVYAPPEEDKLAPARGCLNAMVIGAAMWAIMLGTGILIWMGVSA